MWKGIHALGRVYFINGLKIRDKLIIFFIGLVILPIFLIFIITYIRLSDTVENKISSYSLIITREICNNVDKTLKDTNDIEYYIMPNNQIQSILLKQDTQFNENSMVMLNYIREILNSKEYILSIAIINNSGFTYFDSKIPADKAYSLAELRNNGFYDRIVKANGEMVWLGYNDKRNAFTVGMQILAINDLKQIGIMIINYNMNEIGKIFSESKVEKSGVFYVVDKNGEIVFHTDKTQIKKHIDNRYISQFNSSEEHLFSTGNKGKINISYVSAFVDWRYIYEFSEEEMMKEVNYIQVFLIFVFCAGGILAILFAIIISFSITKPIKQLVEHMNKVELGNLNVRIKLKTKDEIGQLGQKFNKMIANIQNLINTVYKEELMRKNAELEALQAQINPHFLYNTLDSINALAELKGIGEVSQITVAFSKLLRASISNDKSIVTLGEEIKYINNYMTIIKIRFSNKIKFITDIQEETLPCLLPKLIIQPIVENSVIHGLEGRKAEGTIEIKSWLEEDILYIKVADNGAGMDKIFDEYRWNDIGDGRHTGIGLKNVIKRIQLMYGSEYDVDICSKKDEGTAVTIRLPKQYGFQKDDEK